jgi:hypothetical protein
MADALIYEFFETGLLIGKTLDNRDNLSFSCKFCKKNINGVKSRI